MKKIDLPQEIAIFPLSHAIFFPKTILPLNIFEDRYIQLVSDCMKDGRMFGMIQPKIKSKNNQELYQVGCLGKIITFNETDNKRFMISLSGLIRFKIKKELNREKLYRKFIVDYSDFTADLQNKKNENINFDINTLLKKIKLFFEKINFQIKFNELVKLNFDQLINTVCMIAPFSVVEKQKLIETIKIDDKLKILDEIINFQLFDLQENLTIQ